MFWDELPGSLRKILMLTIAGSVVAGGLIGAVTGVLATVWVNTQTTGWHTP